MTEISSPEELLVFVEASLSSLEASLDALHSQASDRLDAIGTRMDAIERSVQALSEVWPSFWSRGLAQLNSRRPMLSRNRGPSASNPRLSRRYAVSLQQRAMQSRSPLGLDHINPTGPTSGHLQRRLSA
jgi:hypothetical protein